MSPATYFGELWWDRREDTVKTRRLAGLVARMPSPCLPLPEGEGKMQRLHVPPSPRGRGKDATATCASLSQWERAGVRETNRMRARITNWTAKQHAGLTKHLHVV